MRLYQKNSGQVLLIMVLVMSVALTVGLAVVSRSVTDIATSHQEEESAQAFSAAEAGIEQALIGGSLAGTVGSANYSVSAVSLGGGKEFVFPEPIAKSDTQSLWLMGHTAGGELDPGVTFSGETIDFYWGNEGAENTALEVMVYYDDGGVFKVKRDAFDPDDSRRNDNSFGEADDSGPYSLGNKKFSFKKADWSLPTTGIPYLLRLRLLYNEEAQNLGVGADADFPSQGKCYESVGTATAGVSSKVRQCQFYSAPPAIFDFAVLSGSNLEK